MAKFVPIGKAITLNDPTELTDKDARKAIGKCRSKELKALLNAITKRTIGNAATRR